MLNSRFLTILFAISVVASSSTADERSDALKNLVAKESPVRFDAARTLRRLAPHDKDTINALVNALRDSGAPFEDAVQFFGPRVSHVASEALVRIGKPAVPELINALRDDDPYYRSMVAQTISSMGPAASSALPELKTLINDENSFVRGHALDAIAHVSPNSDESFQILAGICLHGTDPASRESAIEALFYADSVGSKAIPILVESLDSEDGEIISAAVLTLAKYGSSASSGVDKMINLLNSDKRRWDGYADVAYTVPLRSDVAQCLGAIGPESIKAIPRLTEIARDDEDIATKLWAAAAIVRITPGNESAQSEFQRLVGAQAWQQLAAIGDDRSLSVLLDILRTDDPTEWKSQHCSAIECLGKMGEGAKDAVPLLMQFANREDKGFDDFMCRLAAIEALGEIGPPAEEAIPMLTAIRDAPAAEWLEWRVSDCAENALRYIQKK